MQPIAWIICEDAPRWAPALRRQVGHPLGRLGKTDPAVQVIEARALSDVSRLLGEHEDAFVAVEVHRDTLGKVLAWLPQTGRRFPAVRVAALLDGSLFDVSHHMLGESFAGESAGGEPFSVRSGLASHRERRRLVEGALHEAGALDAAASGRELHRVVSAGLRHARLIAAQRAQAAKSLPFTEQVWATLPWEVRRP